MGNGQRLICMSLIFQQINHLADGLTENFGVFIEESEYGEFWHKILLYKVRKVNEVLIQISLEHWVSQLLVLKIDFSKSSKYVSCGCIGRATIFFERRSFIFSLAFDIICNVVFEILLKSLHILYFVSIVKVVLGVQIYHHTNRPENGFTIVWCVI